MPRKPNKTGDHYNDIFPSKLRSLMEERGTKQEDLVSVLGVKSRQSVTGYIDGSTLPTSEKIVNLANYYNVTTDYLLTDTTVKTFDADLRAISDKTGLSAKSIEIIQNINNYQYIQELIDSGLVQFDFYLWHNLVDYGKVMLNDFIENHLIKVAYSLYSMKAEIKKSRNMLYQIDKCIDPNSGLDVNDFMDWNFDLFDSIPEHRRHNFAESLYLDYIKARQNSLKLMYLSLTECLTDIVSIRYKNQIMKLSQKYEEIKSMIDSLFQEQIDNLDEYHESQIEFYDSDYEGDCYEG